MVFGFGRRIPFPDSNWTRCIRLARLLLESEPEFSSKALDCNVQRSSLDMSLDLSLSLPQADLFKAIDFFHEEGGVYGNL